MIRQIMRERYCARRHDSPPFGAARGVMIGLGVRVRL